ncbi:MAG: hypothetical protein K0Q49_1461 [Haloplasmataceae bacterium]|jgi:hypothetical protein|nr:hypothetical protein [Haloplasmataceae bacterium]
MSDNNLKSEFPPASNSYVQPVAGFVAASYAIKTFL